MEERRAPRRPLRMKSLEPREAVASVERALRLLDSFRATDASLSLAQLAERTGLYKSTILRLAGTLETFGYLVRSSEGGYRIGSTPVRLAAFYQRTTQPAERVIPALERLVSQTGESASFSVRRGNNAICLYRVDSPKLIRDHVRPGDVHPIELGASGKAILAFSKPYQRRFAGVRREGIAFASGDLTPDFASVAAPIFDHSGVVGALTVSGPSSRFDAKLVAHVKLALRAAADEVTAAFGGDSRPPVSLATPNELPIEETTKRS
jgi:DNA-binding IclR family transcriptional regulator